MRKALGGIGATAVVLAALALLWIAGEQHYAGCVQAAEARWPVLEQPTGGFFDDEGGEARVRRARAIDECSRLPF